MPLQLGNPNNWEPIFDSQVAAVELAPAIFQPIPPITAPVLIDKPILAVIVQCPNARQNWRLGCWITPEFQVGLPFGLVDGQRLAIQIDQARLISFYPKLADTYRIRFDVPPWHNLIRITAYVYTGQGSPIVGVLEQ